VHYLFFPEVVNEALDARIVEAVGRMQAVIQHGRSARERRTLPLKFPLTRVTSINKDPQFQQDLDNLKPYILEELNVKELVLLSEDPRLVVTTKVDNTLGKRLRKDFAKVSKVLNALSDEQIKQFQQTGSIEIEGHVVTSEELHIQMEFRGDKSKFEASWENGVIVVLDLEVDEHMRQEGLARELINRIQKLRKKGGVVPTDPIEVFYEVADPKDALNQVVVSHKGLVHNTIGVPFAPLNLKSKSAKFIVADVAEVGTTAVKLELCWKTFAFDESVSSEVQAHVTAQDYSSFLHQLESSQGKATLDVNGMKADLELGKNLFRNAEELASRHK